MLAYSLPILLSAAVVSITAAPNHHNQPHSYSGHICAVYSVQSPGNHKPTFESVYLSDETNHGLYTSTNNTWQALTVDFTVPSHGEPFSIEVKGSTTYLAFIGTGKNSGTLSHQAMTHVYLGTFSTATPAGSAPKPVGGSETLETSLWTYNSGVLTPTWVNPPGKSDWHPVFFYDNSYKQFGITGDWGAQKLYDKRENIQAYPVTFKLC